MPVTPTYCARRSTAASASTPALQADPLARTTPDRNCPGTIPWLACASMYQLGLDWLCG